MKLAWGKAARFYCTLPPSYTERWVMSSQGKKGWDTLKILGVLARVHILSVTPPDYILAVQQLAYFVGYKFSFVTELAVNSNRHVFAWLIAVH